MSKFNYSLRSNNGFTIWLPPHIQAAGLGNLHVPTGAELWTNSETKEYPFGTKLTADDRTFRYCYTEDGCQKTMRGAMNQNIQTEGEAIGNAVEGAYTINWRPADKDHPELTYTTENVYEGGYFWIQHAGTTYNPLYKIVKNAASNGTYVTLTLESPLLVDQATPWSTAYRNIYSNTKHESPNWPSATCAIVCVPQKVIAATRYFWGLTWGPCWIVGAAGSLGKVANEREVYFMVDGVIRVGHSDNYQAYQRAGYLLTHNYYTDDMLFMLQLAP